MMNLQLCGLKLDKATTFYHYNGYFKSLRSLKMWNYAYKVACT